MDDTDPESALAGELKHLAGGAKTNDFEIVWEELRVDVRYSGGSSSSLTMSVLYDVAARSAGAGAGAFAPRYRDGGAPQRISAIRPMKVELRPEKPADVEGKAAGVDIEHQTGDALFDQIVYINAPTADPLEHLFANEVVRASVLELFRLGFTSIAIDNGHRLISATTTSFLDLRAKTTTPGKSAVTAFVRLAKGLPPVIAGAGEHPEDPLSTAMGAVIALTCLIYVVGPLAYFFLAPRVCQGNDAPFIPCFGPGIAGLLIGLVTGLSIVALVKPSLKVRYAGSSSSSKRVNNFCIGLRLLILAVVGSASAILIMQLVG